MDQHDSETGDGRAAHRLHSSALVLRYCAAVVCAVFVALTAGALWDLLAALQDGVPRGWVDAASLALVVGISVSGSLAAWHVYRHNLDGFRNLLRLLTETAAGLAYTGFVAAILGLSSARLAYITDGGTLSCLGHLAATLFWLGLSVKWLSQAHRGWTARRRDLRHGPDIERIP